MQSKYYIGEKVLIVDNDNPVTHYFEIGDQVIVTRLGSDSASLLRERDNKSQMVSYPSFAPLSSAQNIMRNNNILQEAMYDEDTKVLIKHGVLSSSLMVSDSAFVLEFMVSKYKKEMAQLLRDQEAAKKLEEVDEDE